MKRTLFCLIVVLFCVSFAQAQSNLKKQLVEQMIRDNAISRNCVKEEGGATKAIDVMLVNLNQDKQPEYLVSGLGSCCGGTRRCAPSIYQKKASGYKRIYEGIGNEEIQVLKTRTNGYLNLRGTLYTGNEALTSILRFNGNRYQ